MRDHLGLKVVALLLGFSLWYAVAREQEAEFSLSIPIELRDLPEGLEVVEESVQQVEVRLRGPAEVLRRLTAQDVNVGVDLLDAEPGERLAYLTVGDVTAPFGARVARVTPTTVRVVLDRTVERLVEIIPRVVGSPAAGFELADIDLSPQRIEVVGPSSRIEGLAQVTTEPVSVDGLREPYARLVRVELDPLVRVAREENVALRLDIREERGRRELTGVAVKGLPAGPPATLVPATVSVRVEGPRSVVEGLRSEDLVAQVELNALGPGRHAVAPSIIISSPEANAIDVISIEPEEVEVRIQ
jgi:YbbR domain-containing protein